MRDGRSAPCRRNTPNAGLHAAPNPARSLLIRHLLAALLIVLAPAFVADHADELARQLDYQLLAAGFAAAYLVSAAVLARRSRMRGAPTILDAVFVAASALAPVIMMVALARSDAAGLAGGFARRDLVVAAGLVLALGVALNCFAPSRRRSLASIGVLGLAVLACGAGLLAQSRGLFPGSRAQWEKQARVFSKEIDAPFYTVSLRRYHNVIAPSRSKGGGLARFGNRALLVTGDGTLYVISEGAGGGTLAIRRLALRVPLNTQDLVADHRPDAEVESFRVTDILARESADRMDLFAAHHYWHRDRHCFGLRISQLRGSADELLRAPATTAWETVYETTPCLEPEGVRRTPFTGFVESGGRLAQMDTEHLLLTTGDHEFDGLHSAISAPQDPASSYGKTLSVNLLTRAAEVYSSGHRDAQGLFITRDGETWSTEHGPQGGDELNRIVAGQDYGWPSVTLGTDYGRTIWPLSARQGSHAGFTAPVYSWSPAIGVSNLIRLEGKAFPLWRGELLVGSLPGKALWRMRLEGDHVLYAAPINLGYPVRDLEEDDEGRILVWTDEELMTLEPERVIDAGESQAAPCLACHTLYPDLNEHGSGPNLQGIVGRAVASAPGFRYSEALQDLGGEWSRERLDAFLTDPQHEVPGNAMSFPGIEDPAHRKAIIDYLASRKRSGESGWKVDGLYPTAAVPAKDGGRYWD